MKTWIVLLLLAVGMGSALARAAAPPEGVALAARYRAVPACRMRISAQASEFGRNQQLEATLLFRRPGYLRIECDGPGDPVWLVRSPREHRVYYPKRSSYRDLRGGGPGQLWDGFANPPRSLAALLEPGPADRAAIEQLWLARLEASGEERVQGVPCRRFEGPGPLGARLELWTATTDGLIRRLVVRRSTPWGDSRAEIRIEVEHPREPPPAAAFHLAPPAGARDLNQPRAVAVPAEPPPVVPGGGALRLRVAQQQNDPVAMRVLAGALLEEGQAARALPLALALAKQRPSAGSVQLLARVYMYLGANNAVVNTCLRGMERYGLDAVLPDPPGRLAYSARATRRTAEVTAVVERLAASKPLVYRARLELAQLYADGGQSSKAAAQFGAILALPRREGLPGAPDVEQLDVLAPCVEALGSLGGRLGKRDREALAGALRALEPFGLVEGYYLPNAYAALGDFASIERLIEAMPYAGSTRVLQLAQLAEARLDAGERAAADRLFRLALLEAVEQEPRENAAVLLLAESPRAREFLAPVFRALAAAERAANPLQGAHWLFFAGDSGPAARAYSAYLAASAGAASRAVSADRVVAAALGVRSARAAGDAALADQLLLDAVPDLWALLAEARTDYQAYPHFRALLAGTTGAARGRFLERFATSYPAAAVGLLRGGQFRGMLLSLGRAAGTGEGADAGEGAGAADTARLAAEGVLRRLLATPELTRSDPTALAEALQAWGMPAEAAAVYLPFARANPGAIRPDLLTGIAGSLRRGPGPRAAADGRRTQWIEKAPEEGGGFAEVIVVAGAPPEPTPAGRPAGAASGQPAAKVAALPDAGAGLIEALEREVRRQPGWAEGILSLARWYRSNGQSGKAVPLLAGIAQRRGAPDDFLALGQAELAAGQPERAVAHFETAVQRAPRTRAFNYRSNCGNLLQGAGKKAEALSWWRQAKPVAQFAAQVSQVAAALRGLGQVGESIAFLEARYPALLEQERYPGETQALRSQLVSVYQQRKQIDKILALFPELAMFDFDIEPEALGRFGLSMPVEVWKVALQRLDRAGRRRAALGVYAQALAAGVFPPAEDAYRDLVDRARRLGDLEAARAVLRETTGAGGGNAWARLALAALDAELGEPAAAERIYHALLAPEGAPIPHATAGAAAAARGLAALLGKQPGKAADAARWRQWGEAFSILASAGGADRGKGAAMVRQAQALFPESPCLQVALCKFDPPAEGDDGPWLHALERMVSTAPAARNCPHCRDFLFQLGSRAPNAAAGTRDATPATDRLFARLLAATGEAGGACFLVAVARAGRNRLAPEAEEPLWRKVVERDPGIAAAWEMLRALAERRADFAAAAAAAEKLCALRPDRPEEWQRLAMLYRRAKRPADANAALAKARALDPRLGPAPTAFNFYPYRNQSDLTPLFNGPPYVTILEPLQPW